MVSVFLRLLEYHSGVLFLTTNRVSEAVELEVNPTLTLRLQIRTVDEAFLSRFSMYVVTLVSLSTACI